MACGALLAPRFARLRGVTSQKLGTSRTCFTHSRTDIRVAGRVMHSAYAPEYPERAFIVFL
jgi:hypothetical protein